jgi:predicted tellurium resistance membrane protein TerC
MLDWIMTANGWFAFATLFAMEVVLGIDNIVFISILSGRLPQNQQAAARYIGLALALVMRIALLFTIAWIAGLVEPLFEAAGRAWSGRDLIMVAGGLFLIAKATLEIHYLVEGRHEEPKLAAAGFLVVTAQIVAIDAVFSLDSILTAIGLTKDVGIMIAAVVASMAVMVAAAGPLSAFVNKHPTTRMLALAFLVMIGTMLVADGFGVHVPHTYVYAAMAFAVAVEALNLAMKRKSRPTGA